MFFHVQMVTRSVCCSEVYASMGCDVVACRRSVRHLSGNTGVTSDIHRACPAELILLDFHRPTSKFPKTQYSLAQYLRTKRVSNIVTDSWNDKISLSLLYTTFLNMLGVGAHRSSQVLLPCSPVGPGLKPQASRPVA